MSCRCTFGRMFESLQNCVREDSGDFLSQNEEMRIFSRSGILLTRSFNAICKVPKGGIWNLNFRGQEFDKSKNYCLEVGTPKDFFSESFRIIHFLDFSSPSCADQ